MPSHGEGACFRKGLHANGTASYENVLGWEIAGAAHDEGVGQRVANVLQTWILCGNVREFGDPGWEGEVWQALHVLLSASYIETRLPGDMAHQRVKHVLFRRARCALNCH